MPRLVQKYLEPDKGLKNHKYGLGQPVDTDVVDTTKTTSLSDSVALVKNDVIYFLKDVPDADQPFLDR